jgi:hypothetical protein
MQFVFIQKALRRIFLLFLSPTQITAIVQDESLIEAILYWLIIGFFAVTSQIFCNLPEPCLLV